MPAVFFFCDFALFQSVRNKEGGEILEKVGNNARPERTGPDIQQRKHEAVGRDHNETGNPLVGVADTEYER